MHLSTELNFSDESGKDRLTSELKRYNENERPMMEKTFSSKVIDSGATKTIIKSDV